MRISSLRQRRLGTLIAALAIALPLTACGGGATNNPGNAGAPSGTTAAGGLSMSVAQPASGASVSAPFDVKINSSVPLGATSTGMHHVHIWFDGEQSKYTVVESDTTQIKTLATGSHTMHVSLRNANHSAAGVEVEVPIMVNGSGGGSGATTTPGTTSSPYSYGY